MPPAVFNCQRNVDQRPVSNLNPRFRSPAIQTIEKNLFRFGLNLANYNIIDSDINCLAGKIFDLQTAFTSESSLRRCLVSRLTY